MGRTGHRSSTERAATTLEYVGIAVAVAALLTGAATGMRSGGGALGGTIGALLERAASDDVVGASDRSEALTVAKAGGPVIRAAPTPTNDARWRHARELRLGGGAIPVRVPRDDLRMSPVLPRAALWSDRWTLTGRPAGIDSTVDVHACAACAALEWSHELRTGGATGSTGRHTGFEATVETAAHLSLAAVDAGVRARRDVGAAKLQGAARGRANVGGDADARARLRLGPVAQELELQGGVMAGAVARGEASAGIDLLGIAIRQGGRAEGWAGAGARGTVDVRRSAGMVQWRLGWGAALGLGGAAEWHGSVDVSGVPIRHRRVATGAIIIGLGAAGIHVPINPFTSITRSPR